MDDVRKSKFLDHGEVRGERAPCYVPDHRLIRIIGEGNYGEVWLAESAMGVHRAVKIVRRGIFSSNRFERELKGLKRFEPFSRQHSGLVDILHVGVNEDEGYLYYVMELADDISGLELWESATYAPLTLSALVRRAGQLDPEECLRIILAVGEGLHFLHRNRLVHRDVKPSNILMIDGAPKLADVGLVGAPEKSCSVAGTIGFIPPEGPGAVQGDVYALGKVLYLMATGHDVLDFPRLPDGAAGKSYRALLELVAVALRACHSQPKKRYPSVAALTSDLMVVSRGGSIRRLQRLDQLLKYSMTALPFLAAIGVAAFFSWRDLERQSLQREREIGSLVGGAMKTIEQGDSVQALPSLVEALALETSEEEARLHRLRIGTSLAMAPQLIAQAQFGSAVDRVRFSADDQLFSVLWEDGLALSTLEGEQSVLPRNVSGLHAAELSEDGAYIAWSHEDPEGGAPVAVWNLQTGEIVHELDHGGTPVRSLSFDRTGAMLVTGADDGMARIWSTESGGLIRQLEGHDRKIIGLEFSPDGELICTASPDNTARVWEVSSGELICPPLVHGSWVYTARFHPSGGRIVTASYDAAARVWELPSGREVRPQMKHKQGVHAARFSPDGRLILTASFDGTIGLWHAEDHRPFTPASRLHHGSAVLDASFSPQGKRVVASGADGSIRVWRLPREYVCEPFTGVVSKTGEFRAVMESGRVNLYRQGGEESCQLPVSALPEQMVFDEAQQLLLLRGKAGSKDEIITFDPKIATELGRAKIRSAMAVAVSAGDGEVVVCQADQLLRSDVRLEKFRPFSLPLIATHCAISPDGQLLAVAAGNEACLVATRSGRVLQKIVVEQEISCLAFSEFNLLAIGTSDAHITPGSIQLVNPATGSVVQMPTVHTDGISHLMFTATGEGLLSSGEDARCVVWTLGETPQINTTLRHDWQVRSAAVSPDGILVATASHDQTVRVWSLSSGEAVTPPLHHPHKVERVVFLDDSTVLTRTLGGRQWRIQLESFEGAPGSLRERMAAMIGSAP